MRRPLVVAAFFAIPVLGACQADPIGPTRTGAGTGPSGPCAGAASFPSPLPCNGSLGPDIDLPPAIVVRGTVYMDGAPIQGVEVKVDAYVQQGDTLYGPSELPVDSDGAWAQHLGYWCDPIDFAAYSVRARYRRGTDEWKVTPRQPVFATPPTSCDSDLIADDIVVPGA